MTRALTLVALLGLAACSAPPPATVATPPARAPEFERANLADCAEAQANIAKANDILARRGSAIRVDLDNTPCTAPRPDSGMSYAKPTPPRTTVTCRSYRAASSGSTSVTCTSDTR